MGEEGICGRPHLICIISPLTQWSKSANLRWCLAFLHGHDTPDRRQNRRNEGDECEAHLAGGKTRGRSCPAVEGTFILLGGSHEQHGGPVKESEIKKKCFTRTSAHPVTLSLIYKRIFCDDRASYLHESRS